MRAEEAIEVLGFGLFQKRLVITACVVCVFVGTVTGGMFFLTYSPNYRCRIPGLDNDTFNPIDDDHQYLINTTLPEGKDKLCSILDANSSSLYSTVSTYNDSDEAVMLEKYKTKKCDKWVYDKSIFTNTIATEYNFVCDGAIRIAHTRMVFFAGLLVGSSGFGICGDLFGRKTAYFAALVLGLVSGLIIPWISNAESYTALAFFSGGAGIGTYINIFGLLTEFIEKRKRIMVVSLTLIAWVCGLLLAALIAYLIREWRYFQLALICSCIPALLSFFFVPESIRWLMRHGKFEKANDIVRRVAETNRVAVPEISMETDKSSNRKDGRLIMIKVITTPVLFKRFLIVVINWVAVSMTYYGMTLNSGNITGNIFLEFALSSIIEVPAYVLVMLTIDRKGRKLVHMTIMIVGGLSCISTIFPVVFDKEGLQALTVTLATIGKAAVTGGFHSIYIYTPELFPTSTRMSVLGVCSCLGRIGSMVAPYFAELGKLLGGKYSTVIPLLIFGGVALSAGLLCIMLPETKGVQLPDTIEDAEDIQRKRDSSTQCQNRNYTDRELTCIKDKLPNGLHPELESIL